MKNFLIIIVTGLLWCNISIAKTINIEDRVILNVPENFQYLKNETPGEILEFIIPLVGSNVKSYLVGTNKSIKFAKLYQESPDTIYEPIYVKLEKKNFTSEQAQMKFVVREIKKIFKKVGYEGVLWILFGDDKLEDIDDELYQFVTEIRNMNDNEIKKELKDINKDFVDGIRNSFGEMSRFIKISKFNIKKSQFNDPMISFFIKYNIQGFSGSLDFLGFVKNEKPIILLFECINTCPSGNKSLKKIIKPTFEQSIKVEKTLSLSQNSDLVKQLEALNILYKSGALTKKEFEKAKKKLLN